MHVHIGSSAYFVIKETKKIGLIYNAHSHNTSPNLSPLEISFRLFSYPTRYIADYYLACSREAGADRFGNSVVTNNRFSVLSNGIDVKRYMFSSKTRSSMRRDLGIAPEQKAICHIERFFGTEESRVLTKGFRGVRKQPFRWSLVSYRQRSCSDLNKRKHAYCCFSYRRTCTSATSASATLSWPP